MTDAEHADAPGERATDDVAAGGTPSVARRWLHVLGAVLVAVVLPVLVGVVFAGELGGAAVFAGLLFGAVGAKIGGTRRMLYVLPAVGVAAGVGAFTAYDWWWVGLLALVGVIAGGGFAFGWFPSLLMIPYAATFATPTSSGWDAVIFGVFAGLGTGYGIVLARRFGAAPVVEGDRLAVPVAIMVAVVFGAVLAASAALGVALGWTEPYWVPEPVLILVLYIVMGKRDRIRGKAIGTAVGVAAALPIAILAPSAWVTRVIAVAAVVLAFMHANKYWLMYGLYTFALVLALAAPGQVATEAEYRGFEILTGVGLLVVGLAVVHALGNWLAKRSPQAELAPNL